MVRKNGPWIIKDSVEKYRSSWLRVREDHVIRPDKKHGVFGVVEALAGVSVLPVDEEGNVYLTKEFHYAVEEDSIETVSGAVEKGEEPLQTAKRELKEELGIEAGKWTHLGLVNPFTTVVKAPADLYIAEKLSFSKARPDDTERIEVLKVGFEDALKMVLESRITHGPSAVLILKAAHCLNK
jgi:8-oxo-dGTP pyrophosphatase MutT (NUDIX family)